MLLLRGFRDELRHEKIFPVSGLAFNTRRAIAPLLTEKRVDTSSGSKF